MYSALGAGCALLQEYLLILVSVRGRVNPRIIFRSKVLGKLKNVFTSSGFESATFGLVASRLNHLRYRVPHTIYLSTYTNYFHTIGYRGVSLQFVDIFQFCMKFESSNGHMQTYLSVLTYLKLTLDVLI
jgi:hypothetical protein